MLRMASACTSLSRKAFISLGLGSSSLRMILMTLSRVQEDREIAFQHFQPGADFFQPVGGAALQHLAAVRGEGDSTSFRLITWGQARCRARSC